MPAYDYDLFVIGAGSGGIRAARAAASYGARVAIAEESELGGTCVNAGCIPKKLLFYGAHFRDDFEDAAGFGWSVGRRRLDWTRLIGGKNREIARLDEVYRQMLSAAGVELIEGRAAVIDAHTVAVNGQRKTTRYILVATGSRPARLDIPGIEHAITSDDAFFLQRVPARVIIVGGGYIGVEFAAIFSGSGAHVTLVHRGPLFLRGFDDDVRAALAREMSKRGMDLRFNARVERIEKHGDVRRAFLAGGGILEADEIMYATGRVPNTRGLGLEQAGVQMNARGAVVVDAYSRSAVPSIFAAGDCTDRLMLTPMAIVEGHAVAETLFNNNPTPPDYTNVVTAVFSQPSVGAAGLTEEEARKRYGAVEVYRSTFRPLKHPLPGPADATLVKPVVAGQSDRCVGCHMGGPDAGEIIQGFAVALKCGATKAQFDATLAVHPTAAEEFVNMREKAG